MSKRFIRWFVPCAALAAFAAPVAALRVDVWAYYWPDGNHHCEVHFPMSGRVIDFGAMPQSFCQTLVNGLNMVN